MYLVQVKESPRKAFKKLSHSKLLLILCPTNIPKAVPFTCEFRVWTVFIKDIKT